MGPTDDVLHGANGGQVDGLGHDIWSSAAVNSGSLDFSTNAAKWGGTPFGSFSGTVTWSPATNNFAGQPFNFDGPVSGTFLTATRDAFNTWEAVANIKFSEVNDAADVDIRLGFAPIDGQFNVLGRANFNGSSTFQVDLMNSGSGAAIR